MKEKFYQGPKPKAGGSKTNKEKLKNKPLMMLRPKKNKQSKVEDVRHKIKNIKQQLGHMSKHRNVQVKMKLKKQKR